MTGVPVVMVVGGRFVWAEAVVARLVAGRVAPGAENCGTVAPGFCGCAAGTGVAAGFVAAAAGLAGVAVTVAAGVPGALVTRVGAARVGTGLVGFVSEYVFS